MRRAPRPLDEQSVLTTTSGRPLSRRTEHSPHQTSREGPISGLVRPVRRRNEQWLHIWRSGPRRRARPERRVASRLRLRSPLRGVGAIRSWPRTLDRHLSRVPTRLRTSPPSRAATWAGSGLPQAPRPDEQSVLATTFGRLLRRHHERLAHQTSSERLISGLIRELKRRNEQMLLIQAPASAPRPATFRPGSPRASRTRRPRAGRRAPPPRARMGPGT